ncbi:MAG: 2Fe-2S iron-sulfur cluster binding domain-containing protein, partial [Rhizobiaceae bacterium]|nr:2Fe-2S iron-sulfur cluster binding domain-containing protein [Rhizobiaceae bacterium]
GLKRKSAAGATAVPLGTPAETPVPVQFLRSIQEARWEPGSGTLLELAEARGLQPEFSCRVGDCGSCRTQIISGDVAYTREPTALIGKGEALICCAVPAATDGEQAEPVQLDL